MALDSEDLEGDIPPIQDPSSTMNRFYERLAQLARSTSKDHVRIGIYGDSNMTLDLFSGFVRRILQSSCGDAGHGYVAIGRPWSHYRHQDVVHGLDQTAWKEYAVSTRKVADGWYGVGGIASDSSAAGAKAWVATAGQDAPVGRSANRVELHFLQKPGAGAVELRVDGTTSRVVDAQGEQIQARVERVDVPEGPHRVEVVAKGRKPVRVFGVAMERYPAGIVVDSLGIGGVSYHALATAEPGVAKQALGNRRYDLVVFLLGTNTVNVSTQPVAVRKVIAWHKEALPQASLLIMSPPDHIRSFQDAHSDPSTVRVVRQLRAVAGEAGVAYWDFWSAMGGDGSMLRFHKRKWNQWDLYHLNPRGARFMANRFVHALWQGFDGWAAANPRAACQQEIGSETIDPSSKK